jgi:phenylalanyl-tRNA synthetase beta chain
MKISVNWLREFLSLPEAPEEIADLLTKGGLEVVQIEQVDLLSKEKLAGLVVGQVESCQPHPHADRLQCTRVAIGSASPLSIICGAPNVAVGQKVVVAPVGTTLYPYDGEPFTIRAAKIRGLYSEGMLCAEDEIGLGSNHETILSLETTLPPGTPLTDYFSGQQDHVLTIELTPNHFEAASHLGIARTLRALLDRPLYDLKLPSLLVQAATPLPLHIHVYEPQDCPRYAGILVKNVQVKPSPTWLQHRLKAIGQMPINNLVDITNLVMYELGQPLHAFDYDCLQGKEIQVRRAKQGEQLTTLDGITRTMMGEELVIADAQECIALAGMLGGKPTAVSFQTTNVFLESAYFSPQIIRRAAKHHKLQTEASYRYERGTDPWMPALALQRAYEFLQMLAGGELALSVDCYPAPVAPLSIEVKYEKFQKMIGHIVPPATIHRILSNLDIDVVENTTTAFKAIVPPYRAGIACAEEVIEEILRIDGYDRVITAAKWYAPFLSDTNRPMVHQIAHVFSPILVSNGYQEIYTNSLTAPYGVASAGEEMAKHPIQLLNPLSERLTMLRKYLVFSGLEVIAYNINRKQTDLKLFELGKVYYEEEGKCMEQNQLGIWLTGHVEAATWLRPARLVCFQDLHAIVHALLSRWSARLSYKPFEHFLYQGAIQMVDGQGRPFIFAGEVASAARELLGIQQPVFFVDINLDLLSLMPLLPLSYQPISKFPAVKRELSLVLDNSILFEAIKRVVIDLQIRLVKDVQVVDVYQGPSLPAGKKAYAISFTLQDDEKTLDEATIRQVMEQLMQAFQEKLAALIRM